MLHLPLLRQGRPYESADKIEILHHATGRPVALVSQANSGLIARDLARMDPDALESFTLRDLIRMAGCAGEYFLGGTLPCGNESHSFDDYVRMLSATTGSPVTYCRNNARKIHRIFAEMERVLTGLMRGLPFETLDRGHALQEGRMVSFRRAARVFGAVLPSNSPGVHSLWIPATCLKMPVALKPGREEPWTPLRVIESWAAAGVPRAAFGFYPTDHAGAAELLRGVDRSMLFGDARTTAPWRNDPRVELHGPGYSKIVIGDDCVDQWPQYIDLIVSSISANGGRSCINASGIWTPRFGRQIAEAVAQRLAAVAALPVEDERAEVAAFANPQTAAAIDAQIESGLREPGAVDVTQAIRGSPRLVKNGSIAYLLPTIVWIEPKPASVTLDEGGPRAVFAAHPLADREYLFPFASVVECPSRYMPHAIGSTLVCTAITKDQALIASLMRAPQVDRLNLGAIPTWQLSWDQPHEGNLFEHLYRQRAFQAEAAA